MYDIPGYTFPKYNTNVFLSWAKSTHLKNLYQRPAPNCKFDFLIPSQAHNDQKFIRDQQRYNNNTAIMILNLITVKLMGSILMQFICMIDYNDNFDFDSDNNVEFVDINLLCNKSSV